MEESEHRTARDVLEEIANNRREGDKLYFELWRMFKPIKKQKENIK